MPEDTTLDPQSGSPAEKKSASQAKAATSETGEPAKAAKSPKAKGDAAAEGSKAKAAKKEAVEDKPFGDFITQDYLPALEKALAAQKVPDLQLSFANKQVKGQWLRGQRQFTVYFAQDDINSQRAFSCSPSATQTSTLEPFLLDERKITLDLLVFGVVQRLNAQKWFGNN
ncbi:MAG TPA: DUF2996 domain-containing protein [Stenomitos sp.]